jgi:hypothetical protein
MLFLGALTTRLGQADEWSPQNPKPMSSPETWMADALRFFSDFWAYLTY